MFSSWGMATIRAKMGHFIQSLAEIGDLGSNRVVVYFDSDLECSCQNS